MHIMFYCILNNFFSSNPADNYFIHIFLIINEPLVFGVPTVLNILTFIPSMICVAINLVVAYLSTAAGLMNKTCMSVPWTLPAPLYAFLSTMDYRAIIIWFVLFAINIIIFIPFMKSYDKQMDLEDEKLSEQGE